MSQLSQEQELKRAAIQKTATIWGGIVAVLVGLLLIWVLGSQGPALRFGGAVVAALVAGGLVFKASFKSGAKSSECATCGAPFSLTRSDRSEVLASSEPREEREEQEDKSTKVTTWTEEVYDVTETYTCSKCDDITTKQFQTTRRKDEESIVEPPVSAKGDAVGQGEESSAPSAKGAKGDPAGSSKGVKGGSGGSAKGAKGGSGKGGSGKGGQG
jgi:uncharacterized membrane protein YgcG